MNILVLCLFIAALLPFLTKAPLAIAMNRIGGYDNRHPRSQQAQLTGFGARALAVHQNSFEALLVFATAAITALAMNKVSQSIETAAILFIVMRVLYSIFYLMNLHVLRSTAWFVGIFSCFYILWQCVG